MTLVAHGLHKRFGRREVVRDVSLQAQLGEIVGLLGPNGAGKTTCFAIMAGLVKADEGQVRLGEEDVTRLPLHQRARRGLGYLTQEASAFRGLTVRGNLEAVLCLQPKLTRTDIHDRIEAELARFDLGARAGDLTDRLSGGERRRLELARSLIVRPRWLLLDEPFAGVDPIGVAELQAHLESLKGTELAVLVTDHQARATLSVCDRVYVLSEGRVVAEGSPESVTRSESVVAQYLGPGFRYEPEGR